MCSLKSQNLMAIVNTSFLLLLCFFFTAHIRSPSPSFTLITTNTTSFKTPGGDNSCIINLEKLRNGQSKCLYNQYCTLQGYVNYLYIFHCICGGYPFLGYCLLALWLLVLLYLLADTASQYFCPSVERLSRGLRLSPAAPGVTLLSLGNGSPDVFASIASFRSGLLGAIALKTSNKAWPAKKGLLFPWLAMGLLMSVLWTCVIAEELVGMLLSLGFVFGINPSILGSTVLAWGSSIADLIANVAMAMGGGQDGAQIAFSGCYAGPILNTLAGLGSSLVVSAWSAHPMPFVIPVAPQLSEMLGFMIGGLVWALVILPKREMKLDRVLGVGLLAIYSCFLSLRLSQGLGLVKL